MLRQLDANEDINNSLDKINPAGFSLEGVRDRQEWNAVRAQLSQMVSTLGGNGQGGNKSRSMTVRLQVGNGRELPVDTDEEGARNIVRALETAKLRAGR